MKHRLSQGAKLHFLNLLLMKRLFCIPLSITHTFIFRYQSNAFNNQYIRKVYLLLLEGNWRFISTDLIHLYQLSVGTRPFDSHLHDVSWGGHGCPTVAPCKGNENLIGW